ncbi:MAG: UpxY family transcription antiterminator [Bacteroidales bacterium]|nr:UpxY family transcription antiterminator [Candidatus Egerieousia equi]
MSEQEEHWYAFRIFRNGKKFFMDTICNDGKRYFIPTRITRTIDLNYKEEIKKEVLFQNLVFVRAGQAYIENLATNLRSLAGIYRNTVTKEIAQIPDTEMDTFIYVLTRGLEQLDIYEGELRKNDRVRVTEGVLKGAEGYIVRIKGNRRFVVSVSGVAAVATAYIPQSMLQKIND